jgi:PadR family transcriptional regulator PadR
MMSFRSDVETLILASLEDGPKFGYDIARHIKQRSNSGLKLGEGQLYPVLHRMLKAGAVEAEWEMPEGATPRKVYSLTQSGRKKLADSKKKWKSFVASVESVLGTTTLRAEVC